MSTPSKVIARTDTHTHTHAHDENITSTAYAGGKCGYQSHLCDCDELRHRNVNSPTEMLWTHI